MLQPKAEWPPSIASCDTKEDSTKLLDPRPQNPPLFHQEIPHIERSGRKNLLHKLVPDRLLLPLNFQPFVQNEPEEMGQPRFVRDIVQSTAAG